MLVSMTLFKQNYYVQHVIIGSKTTWNRRAYWIRKNQNKEGWGLVDVIEFKTGRIDARI